MPHAVGDSLPCVHVIALIHDIQIIVGHVLVHTRLQRVNYNSSDVTVADCCTCIPHLLSACSHRVSVTDRK
jgi:hypothetical protein